MVRGQANSDSVKEEMRIRFAFHPILASNTMSMSSKIREGKWAVERPINEKNSVKIPSPGCSVTVSSSKVPRYNHSSFEKESQVLGLYPSQTIVKCSRILF